VGLLSDVFVATDAELALLRPGTGGPEGKFATVDGKGIDPLKLETLEAIVTQHEADAGQPILHRQLMYDWGDQWVYRFPESLTVALGQLEPDALGQVAEAWAATEEWRRSGGDTIAGRDSLRLWISAVCMLAQRAQHENRSLYLWLSL
jgi:hypothetical protein